MSVEDKPSICSNPEISHDVNRVSIKPPAFMENAVSGWFVVMEAQFNLNKITEESTRFYHILSALPPNVVSQLPPTSLESQSFTQLKSEVLQLYERTRPELFEEIISKKTLTGRPSILMTELQTTARKVGVADNFVRHRFLQIVPETIRPVLASRKEMSLPELAKMADELVSLVESTTVMTVSSPAARAAPARSPRQLTTSSNSTLQPFYSDQRPQVCRAHIFFGPRARTCKPWCKWPKKTPGLQIQPSSRPASRAASPECQRLPEN